MAFSILVPMDGSEMAEHALVYALKTHPDAKITVLHVVGEPSGMFGQVTKLALADDIETAAEDAAGDVLDRAEEIAAEYDREIDTAIEMGHPARAIINRTEGYDTVVIGSHSGSLADRLFVGNIAERVFRRSPIPVTVVR